MKFIAKTGDTVALCELAEYWKESWKEYHAKAKNITDKLEELKEQYSVDEVMDIYSSEFGVSDNIDVEMVAVDVTGNILQKRYNLETARLIGSYSSDLPQNDDCYYEERLYQQDTGAFFLVGHGGRNTKYKRVYEDGYMMDGRHTFSISIAEAKEWIAMYQDG